MLNLTATFRKRTSAKWLTVQEIEALHPTHIILSPGPSHPSKAGVCEQVVRELGGKVPILGVCLGHQAICEALGGIGESFNWELIPKTLSKPFFLAGGLNSENILQAENTVKPYCLDISTGVEENGFKSREKIEEIIKIIRSEK